jgi:hypothetical protein
MTFFREVPDGALVVLELFGIFCIGSFRSLITGALPPNRINPSAIDRPHNSFDFRGCSKLGPFLPILPYCF